MHTSKNTSEQGSKITRRVLIAGAALLAAPITVLANTQKPPVPLPEPNRKDGRFAGKVVLVTGGTSGIGQATARAFAMEGAKVVFNGRRADLGKKIEAQVRADGGDLTYHQSDVRFEKQVQAFVAAAVAKHGRIDIAFNNAGIENRYARLHEMTESAWRDTLDTNTTGQFFCVKHELRQMLAQTSDGRGGTIVNTCSQAGYKAFPQLGPYIVSNHGRLGLTRVAALEYAKDNIRIASIAPGIVDTPMIARLGEGRQTREEQANSLPIGRMTTPEEIARTVMLLASDDATALHGSNVDVTAGLLD
jgi:NAD(P)-dependent dehydrogenase (short-subunit alcohol dehydrogenase family)